MSENESIDYLTLRIGDLYTGVPVGMVQEVNRQSEGVTHIPGADESLRGVIALRGEVVTVVDLRVLVGYEPGEITATSRNVVVDFDGERIAFFVDEVCDVITVINQQIDEIPQRLTNYSESAFKGVYKTEDGVVALLDVRGIIESSVVESR